MKQTLLVVLGLVALLFVFAFLADLGYINGLVVKSERKDIYGMPIVQGVEKSTFDGTAVVNNGGCSNECQVQLTNSGGHMIGTDVDLWDLYKCPSMSVLQKFLEPGSYVDTNALGNVCNDVREDYYAGPAGEGYCFRYGDIVGGRLNYGPALDYGAAQYESAYAFYECTSYGWKDVAHAEGN